MAQFNRQQLELLNGSVLFWGKVAADTGAELVEWGSRIVDQFRVEETQPDVTAQMSAAEQSHRMRLLVGTYCAAVHNVTVLAEKVLPAGDDRVQMLHDWADSARPVRNIFMHPEDYAVGEGRQRLAPGFRGIRSMITVRNGTNVLVGFGHQYVDVTRLAEPLKQVVGSLSVMLVDQARSITPVSPEVES